MNITDGYTSACRDDDDDGITMEDLLETRRLMAEAAGKVMDKMMTADIFNPPLPRVEMNTARYEINPPRSFMLQPPGPIAALNIIENECFVREVTKMRKRKKGFWEKFWASLSHWAYTPVEFYTVWEPAVFLLGRGNVYCHPSLAAEVRRELAERYK